MAIGKVNMPPTPVTKPAAPALATCQLMRRSMASSVLRCCDGARHSSVPDLPNRQRPETRWRSPMRTWRIRRRGCAPRSDPGPRRIALVITIAIAESRIAAT